MFYDEKRKQKVNLLIETKSHRQEIHTQKSVRVNSVDNHSSTWLYVGKSTILTFSRVLYCG